MLARARVRLVHHVFRPDGSPQRMRTGEEQPLHATALGKCLLAFAPVATPPARDLELPRWTGRTCTTVAALEAQLAAARQPGLGRATLGEYEPGVGAAAAPLRASGGTVVGALGVVGPVEELFGVGGELRRPIAEQLVAAAREISGALLEMQATPHDRCGCRRGGGVTERVVAAIDQGTTSTRCLLFNRSGRMLAVAQREHRQHYPRARAGRARRRGDLAQRAAASCRRRCAAPGSPRTTSSRSASPTSARPP